MDQYKEFKDKLRELLREYNITISVESSPFSDWQGVYDPQIVISTRITGTFNEKEIISVDSLSMDYTDI